MQIIRKILGVVILYSFVSSSAAEVIKEWSLDYNSVLTCKTNSDLCSIAITLEKTDSETTKFEVIGPVILAIANKQIVSCESNSVMDTHKARIFDLAGAEIASVQHRGYLRNCDITSDGSLYWFHYNKVFDSVPKNILVVVTSEGNIAYEQTLLTGGDISFAHNGREYNVSIQAPEFPG
jgi:hypothetical protein